MARDTYIEYLRQVPLFARLTKKELAEIARISTEMRFPAGKALLSEGKRSSQFVIITEGFATVSRDGAKVATLGAGDFAGELGLLLNRERRATVTAETDITALVLNRSGFDQMLDDIPAITRKMLDAVAERLSDMDSRSHG